MAVALDRSATERLVQAEPAPGAIGRWRSTGGGEIYFVVAERVPGSRTPRLPVEVKGDARPGIRCARRSMRAVFGRGVIAGTSRFDPDAEIPVIPVALLLAARGGRPERLARTL